MKRRAFLRGTAGVAVGLPLLDILLDDHGEAFAGGDPLPRRYVVTFGGFSLIPNAEGPDGFVPDQTGPGYDLKPALAPLQTHGVQDKVTVVSGLSVPLVPFGEVPPPGGLNFFHRKSPAFFCGQSVYLPVTDKVPLTSDYSSSDQVAADTLDDGTVPFRSLAYRVQVQHYHTVEAWADDGAMSWRKQGAGEAQIVVPQTSPRAAFDSLFTNFTPEDPAQAQEKALELARRGSILDLVDRRGSRLLQRLGSAGQAARAGAPHPCARARDARVLDRGRRRQPRVRAAPRPGRRPADRRRQPGGLRRVERRAGLQRRGHPRARVHRSAAHGAHLATPPAWPR